MGFDVLTALWGGINPAFQPAFGDEIARLKPQSAVQFPVDDHQFDYHFIGQKVWARQINPERSKHNIINDNSSLWVLGFKSEEEGTAFTTVNGGQTEVLGGTLCICYADRFPAIINRDSRVSVISSSITYARNTMWSRVVEESKNGVVHTVKREECPVRFMDIFLIPLYHGDLRK